MLICLYSSTHGQRDPLETGGPLSPEQASYDVTYYKLSVDIEPDNKSISGEVVVKASVLHPMHYLVLDLDNTFAIELVAEGDTPLNDERREGQIWIDMGRTRQPGETFEVTVDYRGEPRVAVNAPWDGGFTWARTESGAHWIATTCQGEGADLWWPCKDHVSDEPDSMDLFVTVPEGLVAACNGRLQGSESSEGKTEFHWFISQPINIYNVALNIAPYRTIESTFQSVAGEEFDFIFYVLPEDYDKGVEIYPEFKDHMAWFEKMFGPYPFRADKYGVVQTPHLGMEHQSIIAYGADFNNGSMTGGIDWGYDALHQHELAHEWWGNLITCADWNDMWIHEGFGAYMQALYCEELGGAERYYNYMVQVRRFPNNLAIAPRESQTANQIYKAPIYFKGAWVLHTLRYLIGDEAFFASMREFIYPDEAYANATDGSQCRWVTTDDFLRLAEKHSGEDLDWFFDLYLRQPAIPTLHSSTQDGELSLYWTLPEGMSEFPVSVEVAVDGNIKTVEVPVGMDTPARLNVGAAEQVKIDPYKRILMETK